MVAVSYTHLMENQTVILEKMITSLLNEKKYPSLRDILVTMNPSDIASVFDGLEPDLSLIHILVVWSIPPAPSPLRRTRALWPLS